MERSDGEGDQNRSTDDAAGLLPLRPRVNPFRPQGLSSETDDSAVAATEENTMTDIADRSTDEQVADESIVAQSPAIEGLDVWSTADFVMPEQADPVGDLRTKIESLQRSVDALTQRAPIESIEPEIVGASKTLRYAQQTADSILADAQAEAAELVANAERQRSDIIRAAREQAERDYGAERDRVRAEAAAWEARRAELISEMAALSAVIGRYHDGLRSLEDHLDLAAESLGTTSGVAAGYSPTAPSFDEPVIDLTDGAQRSAVIEPVDDRTN